VYGPNEEHKGSQASPYCQFRIQAKKTGKIKLFENSESYKRDFIHVSQVIDVHKKFISKLENGSKDSGLWNVGTGTCKSFLQVAKEVLKECDAEIEYVPMPKELEYSYQKYTKADTTKLNFYLNSL
jgi:ADP-L-glycero-D-manno-heptose 6-epimerase